MDEMPDAKKIERFQAALNRFIERVTDDRYILAVVLVGSLNKATIWRREKIGLWIIEADSVSRRLRSDGNDERIFRILVEDGVNIHAEVIPRSRFKQMVEGASRTAFSCNFFAERKIVHCTDPSIQNWFEKANTVATKDQERELLAFATWTMYSHRKAIKRLESKNDLEMGSQEVLEAAHSIAYTEIVKSGKVWEQDAIYRAIELNPKLFQIIYLDVLARQRDRDTLNKALQSIDDYLDLNYEAHLKPLLQFLRKANRVVPLSEISDHFAYSELYPWHLESACEWLERKGMLQKISTPFKLTKRSLDHVEEPAYFLDVEPA